MIGFKKLFDYVFFILMAILALPTLAILITWNALPGESLYPLKQKLEDVALLIASANFGTKADLHAKIVDRRFQETTELLELSSGIGLPELTTEIDSVKQDIVKQAAKTTKAKDARIVKDKTEKMITQLKEYDQELEKEKQKLASQPRTGGSSSQVIVQEVYTTQKEIQVIVKELEIVKEKVIIVEQAAPAQNMIQSSPSSNPTPHPSPTPTPSPSSTSEPVDYVPIGDLPPTDGAGSSPSPTATPVSSPSTPVVSSEPAISPSPAVEGIMSERISLYPLIFGAIACLLIGFLTLVFVKLRGE